MVTVGADPEFVFRDSRGRFVPANEVVGNGDFGRDGSEATGELRPKHATDSLTLVANIQSLLQEGWDYSEVSSLDMLAGHYKLGKPIGGHIHLSTEDGFRQGDIANMLKTTHTELSNCIDPLDERDHRRNHGYGLGDSNWWKTPYHGGIEFRVPGSWLLSPHIAFMNLWLAEATAYAYIEGTSVEIVREKGGCEGIIAFAKKMGKVPHQKVFLKVAHKVFSKLPIDWDEPINRFWN